MKFSKIPLVILGILLLVGLFFILKPNSHKTATQTKNTQQNKTTVTPEDSTKKAFTMKIENGQIVSGDETLEVIEGDEVTITVTSDVADELHVHGYDKSVELTPGKTATLTFTADVSGRFPYELEGSKTELGTLEVQPK